MTIIIPAIIAKNNAGWNRGGRRARLDEYDHYCRNDYYGLRSGVRVKKLKI